MASSVHPKSKRCTFCDVVRGMNLTKAIYQDDRVAVFYDRKPGAATHLQTIPTEHIKNIKCLEAKDIPLLKHMHQEGERILSEIQPQTEYIFGFHFPPSVGHLHLHCIALPLTDDQKRYKYVEKYGLWKPYGKVIAQLESGIPMTTVPKGFVDNGL